MLEISLENLWDLIVTSVEWWLSVLEDFQSWLCRASFRMCLFVARSTSQSWERPACFQKNQSCSIDTWVLFVSLLSSCPSSACILLALKCFLLLFVIIVRGSVNIKLPDGVEDNWYDVFWNLNPRKKTRRNAVFLVHCRQCESVE